jgi:hypothetical protein
MKGIELPINVLVIIVIAVIVLLGIIAVYFTGWTPYAQSSGVDAVKNAGCRMVVYNCSIDLDTILFDGSMAGLPVYDVNGDGNLCPADTACTSGVEDDLEALCRIHYDADEIECAKICGCV